MEVIEVTEREIEVIEVIERGPQGPQGAGITTLTTQGDLLYRGATTGERLPIGTTGQILKVSSGGIPEWGAAPSSGVSSVSGTSPIVSSGGSTPAISITAATTSTAGSMSAADKTKLDGIASGAEVNVNADWNASSGDAQILNKPTIPSTAADVGAVPTSRTISAGTGLTGGGDLSANRTLAVSYGTTAGTACQGNDSRLSDTRTPSAHAASHASSGSDPLTLEDLTNAAVQNGSITTWNDATANGSINTSWGGSTGSYGGSIDTHGDNTLGAGGSINTSAGGGSINTRGTGSIEFGIAGTRTTLTGTATADRAISLPNAAGTLALTSDITKSAVGLGNVTNNAQTQAAIVPNTAPSAGQLLVGNAGGTAYAPATLSGDATIASTGALTLANTSTARTNIGLGNVANVDTTNAANISSGVLPNARVNWAAPSAIGSTTAAAITGTTGTFSTLSANNGTLTASAPVLDLSQTWNNAAVTFTGMRFNVTNTASAAASKPFDFQIGGTSVLETNAVGLTVVRRLGASTFANAFEVRRDSTLLLSVRDDGSVNAPAGNLGTGTNISLTNNGVKLRSDFSINWSPTGSTNDGSDTFLVRDGAADTLAQRRTANPQTFRLYNTYTDASNYERGFMRWSSNVLQIGTEKLGNGSARALEFQTDGTSRLTISAGGSVTAAGTLIGGPIQSNSHVRVAAVSQLEFGSGGSRISNQSSGVLTLHDSALSDFGRLQFGGTTSSFPALKRSSTTLQVRLADDTAYSVLDAQLRAQGTAPATSGATGTAGDIRYDGSYIYVCTASNTWVRAALATW